MPFLHAVSYLCSSIRSVHHRPDVRRCCGTSLSFVFSELSREAFSKYGTLCYVHSREKKQPNFSDFLGEVHGPKRVCLK